MEEQKETEYVLIGQNVAAEDTSETSSYASSDENHLDGEEIKQNGLTNGSKKAKEQHVAMDDIGMLNEGEEIEEQTYSKFKTQNEIDPENIEKFAPKMPTMDELDDIVEFGKIVSYIP